jgi:DNA ligase-4
MLRLTPTPVTPYSVCSFFRSLSFIKPWSVRHSRTETDTRARSTFTRWVARLRELYDPPALGSTAVLFRLLFPRDDVRRTYDMQEATLVRELVKVFTLPDVCAARLKAWCDGSSTGQGRPGCLGIELQRVLEERDVVSVFLIRSCHISD